MKRLLGVMALSAALAGLSAGYAHGAVKVTASKDYVDRQLEIVRTNLEERIENAQSPNYEAVSNAAMNALSRAEAEAGLTEWGFDPPTIDGKVCSVIFDDELPGWVLCLDNEPTSDTLHLAEDETQLVFDDNYSVTATRTRLPKMADLLTTNDVCSIVTNLSNNWSCELGELIKSPSGDWTGVFYASNMEYSFTLFYSSSTWTLQGGGGTLDLLRSVEGPAYSRRLVFNFADDHDSATLLGTTRIELVRKNALGLARYDDVPSITSNTVTKAYVESLGIEAGVDAQTVTNMTTLTPVYSQTPTYGNDWTYEGLGEGITVISSPEFQEASGPDYAHWVMEVFDGTQGFVMTDYDSGANASTLHFGSTGAITATRTRTDIIGYTLGAQTNIVLAATNVKRYPLFVIDLNPGETSVWQHIELKATTNNFATTEGMTFFTATTSNGVADTGDIIHDWCRIYIASKEVNSDGRCWTAIKNTGELNGYAPLTIAIIVDPSSAFLKRSASIGDNAAWLYEGNDDIIWSYSRIDANDPETDGNGQPCWRMVMPVRWYSTLPEWANTNAVIQSAVSP